MNREAGPLPRPENSIGGGLQHERTALAWERTAIAIMVAGIALARYAAVDAHYVLSSAGIAQTASGGILLMWAGRNNDALHSPDTPVEAVPQVAIARVVGLGTVIFTGFALTLAVLEVLAR